MAHDAVWTKAELQAQCVAFYAQHDPKTVPASMAKTIGAMYVSLQARRVQLYYLLRPPGRRQVFPAAGSAEPEDAGQVRH